MEGILDNKFEIQETMSELYNLGLLANPLDIEEFEDALNRDTAELRRLLEQCEDDDYIGKMTLSDLVKLPFDEAQRTVAKFSMEKRIAILDELTTTRNHYYEQTKRYCGVSKDQLISANDFRSLLGKIKHLEILQNWLYGII